MPGGDRTGPLGMSSMTGRAAGLCAGYGVPGCVNAAGGRGGGFGGGGRGRGGWGRRGWYDVGRFGGVAPMGVGYPAYGPAAPVTPTREQGVEGLKQQAAHLQGALDDIQKRIERLQAEATPQ